MKKYKIFEAELKTVPFGGFRECQVFRVKAARFSGYWYKIPKGSSRYGTVERIIKLDDQSSIRTLMSYDAFRYFAANVLGEITMIRNKFYYNYQQDEIQKQINALIDKTIVLYKLENI